MGLLSTDVLIFAFFSAVTSSEVVLGSANQGKQSSETTWEVIFQNLNASFQKDKVAGCSVFLTRGGRTEYRIQRYFKPPQLYQTTNVLGPNICETPCGVWSFEGIC